MGISPSLFCRRSSARGRAPPQNRRARPLGGEKAQRGLRLLPLFSKGELANSMKGWGGVRNEPSPARPTRPAPRGPRRKGDKRRSGSGNPKGGGARLRGERGAPRFLQPRHRSRRASAPCGFPPFGGFEFGGGIRKGGFPKGGKLRGELAFPVRPPRSSVRMAHHFADGSTAADSGRGGILSPDRWRMTGCQSAVRHFQSREAGLRAEGECIEALERAR